MCSAQISGLSCYSQSVHHTDNVARLVLNDEVVIEEGLEDDKDVRDGNEELLFEGDEDVLVNELRLEFGKA